VSRLSFNSMTADRWSLPEVIDACAEHGVEWIGPWRHKVAEIGVDEAAKRIADAGLKVSSLCRGGFFPAATA
jgi:sugar phosphate isomerase/epimerase